MSWPTQCALAEADISSDRECDDVDTQDMGESEKTFNRKNSTMLGLCSMTRKYVKDTIENEQKFLVFNHHLDVLDEIKKSVQKSKV